VFVKDGDVIRLGPFYLTQYMYKHRNVYIVTRCLLPLQRMIMKSAGMVTEHLEMLVTIGSWSGLRLMLLSQDLAGVMSSRIRSLSTQFRLRHQVSGCLLRADRVTLPQWGFKQEEVVCQKNPKNDSTANFWNIENHVNPLCTYIYNSVPPGGAGDYKTSFFRDFIDINVGMYRRCNIRWTSNNALTPDPDKEPEALTSQAYHWPFMLRTLRMCGWGEYEIKYLLVGNPVIWWSSTASLVILLTSFVVDVIRQKRGHVDFATYSIVDLSR
jgi:dolichyl-phosphate-mannose-protein mannosyltransferase